MAGVYVCVYVRALRKGTTCWRPQCVWLLLLRGLCTFMSAYVPSCHECLCTDMSAMCTVMSDCVPSECVAIATAWPVYRHECHVCPAQLQPA